MYKKAELGNAEWIGTGKKDLPSDILSVADIKKGENAVITIGCMGTFILFINGKRVTDEMYLPLNTDFEKRYNIEYGTEPFEEEFEHRLYCWQADISEFLTEGENEIKLMLAPGFYERYDYGTAKICWDIRLTSADGERHICSDANAVYRENFVTESDMITGETHDLTRTHFPLKSVVVHDAPDTNLYIQDCPADRKARELTPVYLGNGIWDAGEIFTGYPVIKSTRTQTIKIRYGELLNEDGTLDEMHIYNQHTHYITDDSERILKPEFTWLCFRYFEIDGDCEVLQCDVIHADVDVDSQFECAQDTLNWVRNAYIKTQLANMHCGIPSDCPHTERRGYTGDGQLTCAAAMMQLDAEKFYRKWIGDICDCQDRKTGHIQYTAPFVPSGGGPGGWGCAIVVVPYEFYRAYGDKTIFDSTLPAMLHWFEYMESHSENELVTSDLPGVWCLGDWCAPTQNQLNKMHGMVIPKPFVNTYFFIKAMEYFLEICDITGNTQYKEDIKSRIARKKQAITDEYFNPGTGDFADNEQGANAFAVDIGLGDKRTFENIVKHYTATKKYDTGIFGTDIVTRVLFERGRADVAYALLTSEEDISYYNQIQNGATTLLEYWNGVRSQCHPMFGAVTRYMFEYILGIRQTKESAGYRKVIIEPLCLELLPEARGKITTSSGVFSVEYNGNEIKAEIPAAVNAVLKIKGTEIPLSAGMNVIKR